MLSFSKFPHNPNLDIKAFLAHTEEAELQRFKQLLDLSPIGPPTFENTAPNGTFGIGREWLQKAKDYWLKEFDWRKQEDHINSFPNFKTTVQDIDGNAIEIQFLALFSERQDATPIVLLHGWPSSVCAFLNILDRLKKKYSPETLPYHIIVPSLPGYAYSSVLPLGKGYTVQLAASAIDNLMTGLGFTEYIAQGGDLGSFISRVLAMTSHACIGVHLNMMGVPSNGDFPEDGIEEIRKAAKALETGFAFLMEQATRPSTVGHVLSSSPLALLSWIGEKYLEWTDQEPPLEKILETVTLYWLTNTISRSMWHNRSLASLAVQPEKSEVPKDMELSMKLGPARLPFVHKPCGYSMFAHEIIPVPRNWAELSVNLISFTKHEHGGHFAALEQPEELLADVEAYVAAMKEYYKVGKDKTDS